MKSNQPVAAWEGGIHGLIELALRQDGTLFRRVQDKDSRFGYRWSKWTEIGKLDVKNPPSMIEQGFSKCSRPGAYTNWQKWRLPKQADLIVKNELKGGP